MTVFRKFQASDSNEIGDWEVSRTDLLFWANIQDAGLDLKERMKEWHSDPDVSAYILEDGSKIVAYGEIWKETQEVELARLIVNPHIRGYGFGKILLAKLLEKAKGFNQRIWLRVHPKNTFALTLYQRNGFSLVGEDRQETFNQGQTIQFIWLEAAT
jgi:ribosomal protein S18 acetylase RimI-like enzyme